MFFGLTNSPATFQMMMNEIFLEELREGWLTVYMDDMLIHTNDSLETHRKAVHRVLDKLVKHNLFLKPEKCLFEQHQMEFLGVVLEGGTIQMDPAKIKGVEDWPTPKQALARVFPRVPGVHPVPSPERDLNPSVRVFYPTDCRVFLRVRVPARVLSWTLMSHTHSI